MANPLLSASKLILKPCSVIKHHKRYFSYLFFPSLLKFMLCLLRVELFSSLTSLPPPFFFFPPLFPSSMHQFSGYCIPGIVPWWGNTDTWEQLQDINGTLIKYKVLCQHRDKMAIAKIYAYWEITMTGPILSALYSMNSFALEEVKEGFLEEVMFELNHERWGVT